ncbi:tetratricopeptide repeat protein [Nitratidesulfovibrio sp. SRB-5]|uniref:tetratricopeptide repeat protein n=1 Tax=Nitratidesulfovibrio sp. SRB-5 TaxID=2872636 RepID=UPI0010252C0F|nr:tetratricopeptide repeat protein [Nitratidesulfovibrio sp. SRB-5]MBZ2171343.1 tetratricopeptide repeat protein [Nitratidesulfovibrio sp. SRB-5]RXF76868.1 tetratricopeptide repeat protein [Desulfovibrio sp. DS-1]
METGIFKGVYSSVEPRQAGRPGGGVPGRSAARKRYWFVWEHDAGGFVVQPLSASMEPTGERRAVSTAELARGYAFEPDILAVPIRTAPMAAAYGEREEASRGAASAQAAPVRKDAANPANPVKPSSGGIQASGMATGRDATRRSGDIAGHEVGAQTERALRADFATALAQLRRGDRDRAVRALERLAETPGEFVPAHRHMFTDFGINLRKSKLPRIAIRHHLRALDLSPDDSHVHFNIARAYYDMGDMDRAERHLRASLDLTPDLDPSRRFLDFLLERKGGAANVDGTAPKAAR